MSRTCPDCEHEFTRIGSHISQSDCEYPNLTDREQSILIGVLLGDGSVRTDGLFEVSVNSKAYLDHVASVLPEWLLTDSGVHYVEGDDIYRLRTVPHPFVRSLRKDWYASGRKKYPMNSIDLNATVLKHWYCTDGGLDSQGRPCLYSSNEDTEELRDWLQSVGYDVCRDNRSVRFNKDGAKQLFMDIENCPGYEYKFTNVNQS